MHHHTNKSSCWSNFLSSWKSKNIHSYLRTSHTQFSPHLLFDSFSLCDAHFEFCYLTDYLHFPILQHTQKHLERRTVIDKHWIKSPQRLCTKQFCNSQNAVDSCAIHMPPWKSGNWFQMHPLICAFTSMLIMLSEDFCQCRKNVENKVVQMSEATFSTFEPMCQSFSGMKN